MVATRLPRRIQRKRTKGWTKPEGAVYVGRGSRWGSPFKAHHLTGGDWVVLDTGRGGARERVVHIHGEPRSHRTETEARKAAADLYELHTGPMGLYEFDEDTLEELRSTLAGRDLMCWCSESAPCHADVLMEIANR